MSGVDPGFPVAGGANRSGGGVQHTKISEKLHEIDKKFWAVGGCAPCAPALNPPMHVSAIATTPVTVTQRNNDMH